MDLRPELTHQLQLRIVCGQLDVEPFHVIRRAVPPLVRMTGDVIGVADNGCFAVLRTGRAIEVEAVQPGASAVEHLAGMPLVFRLCGVGIVEIQVRGDTELSRH